MADAIAIKVDVDVTRLNALRKMTTDSGAIQKAVTEGVRRIAIHLANKVSANAGGGILIGRSGLLMQSWLAKPFVQQTSDGASAVVDPRSASSALQYAAIHEYGGQAGRNLMTTIPARRYVSLGIQAGEPQANQIMEAALDEAIGKAARELVGA
jgi:phage gpG-like protein